MTFFLWQRSQGNPAGACSQFRGNVINPFFFFFNLLLCFARFLFFIILYLLGHKIINKFKKTLQNYAIYSKLTKGLAPCSNSFPKQLWPHRSVHSGALHRSRPEQCLGTYNEDKTLIFLSLLSQCLLQSSQQRDLNALLILTAISRVGCFLFLLGS